MKKSMLFLSIFFLFADCKEEKPLYKEEKPLEEPPEPEEPQLNTDSIYGTWQLVERSHYSILVNQVVRRKVSDGRIVVFYRNNSFYSSTTDVCPGSNPPISGLFRVINDCSGSSDCIEFSSSCLEDTFCTEGTCNILYRYSFEDNHLFLSPTCCCDEGCSYKYKKTADPEGD